MAQHDFVIDNATGSVVRADINSVLQAIITTNSGNSAPSTTAAGQLWWDSDGNTLYIRNTADNAWIAIAGAAVVVSGVATAATFEPDGDTAAGDNAAIGYTSAEGLILTGQGSTSDITFKNDADGTVFTIPTGSDDVLFADDAKVIVGTSSDGWLVHDGSHTTLVDNGAGNLTLKSNGAGINFQKGDSETMCAMATDGAVTLYYDNAVKLATATGGISVTGNADFTASRLFVGAIADVNNQGIRLQDNSSGRLNQMSMATDGAFLLKQHTGAAWAERFRITPNGNITAPAQSSFYATCAALVNKTGGATTTYLVGSAGYTWTEVQDRNADFDGAGLFTAPVAGFYHMSGTMQWTGLNTATSAIAYLVVSNGNIQILHNPTNIANVGVNYNINISQVVYMDASDTAQLAMYINGAGSDVCDLDNAQFSGYLLG